jgi:hypothetical protein
MVAAPDGDSHNYRIRIFQILEENTEFLDKHCDLAKGLFHIFKGSIEAFVERRSRKRSKPRDEATKIYNDRSVLKKVGCSKEQRESLCYKERSEWPPDILTKVRRNGRQAKRETMERKKQRRKK